MDKYLLTIIALIVISISVVLCVRISGKNAKNSIQETKPELEDDSKNYDDVLGNVNHKTVQNPDPLSHLKADDFTLLE